MAGSANRLHTAVEIDGGGSPAAAFDVDEPARHVAVAEAAGVALVTIADSPLPAVRR
jgi:hypothetical protein